MILELSTPNRDGRAYRIDLLKEPWLTEGISAFMLGNKGCGKSHALAVFAEEAHKNQLPFIFYDKNGDACSLKELGDDVVVIGDVRHFDPDRRAHYSIESIMNNMNEYIKMAVNDGFSFVVDLSAMKEIDMRPILLAQMIRSHHEIAGLIRLPTMVIVDEAHEFAPQSRATNAQKESLRAMKLMASDGRKRAIHYIAATQRITEINKTFIALMNLKLFGKISHHPDFKYIESYLPLTHDGGRVRKMLPRDMERLDKQFVICESDGGIGDYARVRFKNRRTKDLGKTPIAVKRSGGRPSLKSYQLNFLENFSEVENV
jgi:hypothetical protein